MNGSKAVYAFKNKDMKIKTAVILLENYIKTLENT